MGQRCYINFVVYVLSVDEGQLCIQPIACLWKRWHGRRDDHFVFCSGFVDAQAPGLVFDEFLQRYLIDVGRGVRGEGDIKGLVLKIAHWDGLDAVEEQFFLRMSFS